MSAEVELDLETYPDTLGVVPLEALPEGLRGALPGRVTHVLVLPPGACLGHTGHTMPDGTKLWGLVEAT